MTQDYLYEARGETQDSKRSRPYRLKPDEITHYPDEKALPVPVDEATRFPYKQDLSEQEVMFIEALFSNGLDAKRAMREAGYAQKTHVSIILSKPHIAQAIHERMRYENVGVPEVLEMIGKLARADLQDVYTIVVDEDGNEKAVPDLVKAIKSGNTYMLKGLEHNRDGTVKKFIIEDRAPYIDKLCEILGLTNKGGVNKRDSRSYQEKLRDSGLDPKTIVEELEALTRELKGEQATEIYDASVSA